MDWQHSAIFKKEKSDKKNKKDKEKKEKKKGKLFRGRLLFLKKQYYYLEAQGGRQKAKIKKKSDY
jgi:hypothetical protein